MILMVNSIVDAGIRGMFDAAVWPRLAGLAGMDFSVAYFPDPEPLPGPDGFSHLLLSGSELSAAVRGDRDEELLAMIRAFLEAERPIFGICYGHQMLARAIAGDAACRRSETPEFGWRKPDLRPNPIFYGVGDLVSASSHYDEVCNLPGDFTVIACTDHCAVQSYQYRDLPVWGVQFHPEVEHRQGEDMFRRNLKKDQGNAKWHRHELEDTSQLQGNDRLFLNFFRSGTVPSND